MVPCLHLVVRWVKPWALLSLVILRISFLTSNWLFSQPHILTLQLVCPIFLEEHSCVDLGCCECCHLFPCPWGMPIKTCLDGKISHGRVKAFAISLKVPFRSASLSRSTSNVNKREASSSSRCLLNVLFKPLYGINGVKPIPIGSTSEEKFYVIKLAMKKHEIGCFKFVHLQLRTHICSRSSTLQFSFAVRFQVHSCN